MHRENKNLQKEPSPGIPASNIPYSNSRKLHWLPDAECHICGGEVNSWDKRCSRALGYRHIVCEACISGEYDVTIPKLRSTMQEHLGLIPCPGI